MDPLFSIIIPTYNRADLLKLCLDSVVAQTYSNWEAIVVDNYSTDDNEEVALSYNDSRIRFYKNHNNGIIAVSRNYGLSLAKGDFICFLDSDDMWTPDKLEKSLGYLSKYDFIYHDMTIYQYLEDDITVLSKLKGRTLKKNQYINALLDGNPCINSSLVLSRTLVDKVGHISEDKEFLGVEDFDYELRMLKFAKAKYIPEALGYYYVGLSNVSNTEKQAIRMTVLYDKHLKNIHDDRLRKEIARRLSYRQARIYQIHGNKKMATKKFVEALKSHSISYAFRALCFLLIMKIS